VQHEYEPRSVDEGDIDENTINSLDPGVLNRLDIRAKVSKGTHENNHRVNRLPNILFGYFCILLLVDGHAVVIVRVGIESRAPDVSKSQKEY
jgi:hypothetical protein